MNSDTPNDKPREWTLRVPMNNDGSGYIFSGDDIRFPEDDYIKVVPKSAYEAVLAELELAKAAARPLVNERLVAVTAERNRLREALKRECWCSENSIVKCDPCVVLRETE